MSEGFRDFKFGADDIGIFLMESITTGLYKDPMNVLREYISNEMDNDPPPTEIGVSIETKKVTIRGDGPGMDYDGIRDAVKVGFSPKDLRKNVGFRGIGIYSGVAICDKISVTTKQKNNPNYYYVIIDCKGLRKDIKKGSSISLIKSLNKNVKWDEMSAPDNMKRSYGTVVELTDVLEEFQDILDEEAVIEYLETTVPVEFDPTFPFAKKIVPYLRKNLRSDFKIIDLKVNNQPVYRAPKYIGIDPPEFGEITRYKKLLGIYWICQNSRKGKITDEQSRGLVYRKKGFAVGDRTTIAKLLARQRNKQFIDYVTGEIHIVADEILPNTERVEFEPCPERDAVERKLKDEVLRKITAMSRTKSAILNAEGRIERAADIPNKPKFETKDDWFAALSEARKLRDQLKHDSGLKSIPDPLKKKIDRAHNRVKSWIKKNDTPPVEEAVDEGVEAADVILEEEAVETPEKGDVEEQARLEEEAEEITLPASWISNTVKEICQRTGHPDWNEVLLLVVDLLRDESYLTSDEDIRDFLGKLELKLAV